MEKWIKLVISSAAFFGIYALLEKIFSDEINWKLVIVSTIVYIILNVVCNVITAKKNK